jgi:hypothetical protein
MKLTPSGWRFLSRPTGVGAASVLPRREIVGARVTVFGCERRKSAWSI